MTAPNGGDGGREGLFAALRNVLATLLAIGKTRAELLVTELEEEKYRLMTLCGVRSPERTRAFAAWIWLR